MVTPEQNLVYPHSIQLPEYQLPLTRNPGSFGHDSFIVVSSWLGVTCVAVVVVVAIILVVLSTHDM
jgi:ERCC4-related helicase